jgi:hypothetical protein
VENIHENIVKVKEELRDVDKDVKGKDKVHTDRIIRLGHEVK